MKIRFIKKIKSYIDSNLILIKVYFFYLTIVSLAQILISYIHDVLINKISHYPIIYHLFIFWGMSWDGSRYYEIFKNGYSFPNFAFFPGIPLLYKFLSNFLPEILIIRINLLFIFLLILSLNSFIKYLNISESHRFRTLILFLCYPYSIFFLMGYAETLYLIFSIWFLIYLNRNKYFLASIFGLLLGFFKISAICLPLIFFYKFYQEKKINFSLKLKNIQSWVKLTFYSIVTILGILFYFLYLHIYFGDFMKFFVAQAEWGRMDFNQVFNSALYIENFYLNQVFEFLVLIFLITLLIRYFNKLKPELYLFSLFHLMIPLSTGSIMSFTRFSLYAFPLLLIFFSEISNKSNKHYYLVLAGFILFYLILIYELCLGYFIG